MDNQAADSRQVRPVEKYIVSACLAGLKVRYDGTDKLSRKVRALVESGQAIICCPEQTGGLPTPRTPAEIFGGDGHDVLAGRAVVIDKYGHDVTAQFIKGAHECLEVARLFGATKAILKARSPSCGSGAIYDGSFSGTIEAGDGVTTALLKENGIDVLTEEEF